MVNQASKLVPIVQVGHPVLRQEARVVTADDIRSPDFPRLIEVMRDTMRAAPGVGLAAPQIGLPLRIVVMEDDPDGMDPDFVALTERTKVPFHVVINPVVTVIDDELVRFQEGCLSVKGFQAEVPRFRGVRLEALDQKGEPVSYEAYGWHARIVQHECDHLDGTLYVDRMNTRTFFNTSAYEDYEE